MSTLDDFLEVFEHFQKIGYNVVIAGPDKHPASSWRGLAEPFCPRVSTEVLEAALWVGKPYTGFLFPASCGDRKTPPLVVVDVDIRGLESTAIEMFGKTPLVVDTRRGLHMYYRADHKQPVKSRNWVLGEKGIDVKSWKAGVMCPGFPPYIPRKPWDDVMQWTRDLFKALPLFPVVAYDKIWSESRPKARETAREYARNNPDKFVRVIEGRPYTTSGSFERMGDVHPHTLVTVASTGKAMRIIDVPLGSKVYAFDRDDNNPSGQVWGKPGDRWYTDHTLATIWRVLETPPKPARRINHKQDAITELTVHADPYFDVEPAEGLTLIRAPHGTGKTHWAAKRFDHAYRAITIANTAALAEFNAVRFNVSSYRKDVTANKVSTTINSLARIDARKPYDFVHVDEADQVLSYIHAGTIDAPVSVLHKLFDDVIAQAREVAITSADLTDEVINLCVDMYRTRCPGKPIRVIKVPPKPGRRTIKLVTIKQAKQIFHERALIKTQGSLCSSVGYTSRQSVANAAWGYALSRPDLKVLWISGENSRYDLTLQKFHDQQLLDGVDLLFFNPSIQSGVSIDQPVEDVFILHDKLEFDVETTVQMLMRFRDVQGEIIYGIKNFVPRHTYWDDAHLEALCMGLKDQTDQYIESRIPEYKNDEPVDEEFARSWRIATRRARMSFQDPIERLKQVFNEHGFSVIDAIDKDDGDSSGYNSVVRAGKDHRTREITQAVIEADAVSPGEAVTIQRAGRQSGTEPQQLEKRRLKDFYGVDVDETLIAIDKSGRFRRQCRAYGHVWLFIHHPHVLAWLDAKYSKGRQPTEYRHLLAKAQALAGLLEDVADTPCPDHVVDVLEWDLERLSMEEDHDAWAQLFNPRYAATSGSGASWVLRQLTRTGMIKVDTAKLAGGERVLTLSWELVYQYSKAYREKMVQDYERDRLYRK